MRWPWELLMYTMIVSASWVPWIHYQSWTVWEQKECWLYHVSCMWQEKDIFFFKNLISPSVSVTQRMKLLTIFQWSSQGISDEWYSSYITVALIQVSDGSWMSLIILPEIFLAARLAGELPLQYVFSRSHRCLLHENKGTEGRAPPYWRDVRQSDYPILMWFWKAELREARSLDLLLYIIVCTETSIYHKSGVQKMPKAKGTPYVGKAIVTMPPAEQLSFGG